MLWTRLCSLKKDALAYYGCYFLLVVARHITCCYNSLTKTHSLAKEREASAFFSMAFF